jgi:acyl-CoA thioester hydrolase
MPRKDFKFCHQFRVRFAEVDSQSVVFNPRYLEYADLLLAEFWRSIGMMPTSPETPRMLVRQATVDYIKPLRFDDEVDGLMRVLKVGNSSVTYAIELHDRGAEELRAKIQLVYVQVDPATGRPNPWSHRVRTIFAAA